MNISNLSFYDSIDYYEGDTTTGHKNSSNSVMRDIINNFLQKCSLYANANNDGADGSIYSLFLLLHKTK